MTYFIVQRAERGSCQLGSGGFGGREPPEKIWAIFSRISINLKAGFPLRADERVTETVNKTGAIERHLRFIARGAIFAALCTRCARALRTRHALRAQHAHCTIQ